MTVHRDYLELAAAAIDFELSPSERSRLDAHLQTCDACRRRVAGLHSDDVAIVGLPSYSLATAVADRLRPRAVPRQRLDTRNLRLVAIAALLALLATATAVVGAELLRREFERRLAIVPPDPSLTVVQPAPSATPPASASPDPGWQPIEADAFLNAQIHATSVGAQGELLVLGCNEAEAGVCGQAVAWLSSDGIEWSTAILPTDATESLYRASAAVRSGSRTLVGGSVQRDGAFEATIWTTPDDRTWSRAAPSPSFDQATVNGIVEFGEGYVAVGSGLFTEPGGFRAWRSNDGESWTETSAISGEASYAVGVIELEDETLLAWGPVAAVGPGGTAWWRSEDGVSWEATQEPTGLEDSTVTTIEATESEYVAHGSAGIAEAAVPAQWSRPRSGAEWTRIEAPPDPTGSVIHRLRVDLGDVVIAAAEGGAPLTVWHRAPDSDWQAIAEMPNGEAVAVAQVPSDPSRLVLFVRNDQGDTIVWTGGIVQGPQISP